MVRDPTRDADGEVVPHDHPDIRDDDYVIRHIPPAMLVPADNSKPLGPRRISSGAYSESGDFPFGMSVDIEGWIVAAGLSPLHYLPDPSYGAQRLNVGALRRAGCQVGWDPIPGKNPHHALVWGLRNSKTMRKQVARLAITLKKAAGEA